MSFLQCMLKFLLTPNIGILAVIKSANRWLSVNRYCKYGLKITLKTIRKYLIVVLNLNFTGKLFVVWCVYIYICIYVKNVLLLLVRHTILLKNAQKI